jgi:hypothetical protein
MRKMKQTSTNFGAYSKYALPMTLPAPWPRAAVQVRNPALQTCEQRPINIHISRLESGKKNRETHQDSSA